LAPDAKRPITHIIAKTKIAKIARTPSAKGRSERFGMREQAAVAYVASIPNKEKLVANIIPSLSLILLAFASFLSKDFLRYLIQ
jgi:hypothetical protein